MRSGSESHDAGASTAQGDAGCSCLPRSLENIGKAWDEGGPVWLVETVVHGTSQQLVVSLGQSLHHQCRAPQVVTGICQVGLGVQRDIDRHEEAEQSYMDGGVRSLELARNAQALFACQLAREKRRLRNFVLSHCSWEYGAVVVTSRQPSDLFTVTVTLAACSRS